jgi:K+-sensing histidine kinase KdpD
LPGYGLGLAIAAEILDINNGTMTFSRAQIGGLVVTIGLPLSQSTAQTAD